MGFNDSQARQSAAEDGRSSQQPFSRPLGAYTGAPSRTRFSTARIGTLAVKIVPETRENRFVTLIAPASFVSIYISTDGSVSAATGIPLPAGVSFEVPLAGNQELWAMTDAPTLQTLRIQIAPAIVGDLERRL